MAHHKRGKARVQMGQGSTNNLKRRFKGNTEKWKWYKGTPSAHNIIFHHRPRRREERRLETQIKKGVDPDGIAWPTARKPHHYYW